MLQPPPATHPHRFFPQPSGTASPSVTACHQPRQSHQEVTTHSPMAALITASKIQIYICKPAQTKPERRRSLPLAREGALDLKEPTCRDHPSAPWTRGRRHRGSRARVCGTHLGSRPWAGKLPGARRP